MRVIVRVVPPPKEVADGVSSAHPREHYFLMSRRHRHTLVENLNEMAALPAANITEFEHAETHPGVLLIVLQTLADYVGTVSDLTLDIIVSTLQQISAGE